MPPILSVCVPTKNRYYYLKFLVEYFHSIQGDDIELIVQDNTDCEPNKPFEEYIVALNDNRIIYDFNGEELSVIENSDLATSKASGEYVIFIGDDDIFSKHLIKFAHECKDKDIDAVLPIKSSYTWPDVSPRFYKQMKGLYQPTKTTCKVKQLNAQEILKDVLKLGGTDILNLPRIYHALVKRDILQKIFLETGSYYPGPSPDMANAIALCKYTNKYIEIDVPYVISGHSVKSAGGQGAQGKHFGEISRIKHLPKDTAENWSSSVPFYWSGYTIYAESVLKALKRMNMDNYLSMFNYNYMYATCLVFDKNYKKKIIDTYKNVNNKNNHSELAILYYLLVVWRKRLQHHLTNNLVFLLPAFMRREKDNFSNFQLDDILKVTEINDKLIESIGANRVMLIEK